MNEKAAVINMDFHWFMVAIATLHILYIRSGESGPKCKIRDWIQQKIERNKMCLEFQ